MSDAERALRQLIEGADFSAPESVLKVSAKAATVRIPGAGYTIAEYVAHADFWNETWLAKLKGSERPAMDPKRWDWPEVDSRAWPAVRNAFLNRLNDALGESLRDNLGEEERDLLLRIAVHSSYHLGQVVLLKRLGRSR